MHYFNSIAFNRTANRLKFLFAQKETRKRCITCLVIIIIAILATITYLYASLPEISQINQVENNITFLVKKTEDSIELKEVIFNLHISVKDMPKHLIHAVVSSEDNDFYSHHGVSITGIARAIRDMVWGWVFGGRTSGGSTISPSRQEACYF